MSNNENNKDKGFSQGITLIIIGVIFTFVTIFDYDIDWHAMMKLWPLLLVIIGVCIMPINKWIRTIIALALLAFGFVAYQHKADDTRIIDKTELRSRSNTTIIINDDDDD